MKTHVALSLTLTFQIFLADSIAFGLAPGEVLHTIPNPHPMTFDTFGATLHTFGNNIAIAALGAKNGPYYEGAVYLFDGSESQLGQQLHEFRRPQLQDIDRFGHALASSGTTLAIADPRFYVGGFYGAGAVHVFDSVSGQHLRSILNPSPAHLDGFGWDVATSGSTLVLSELSETALDPKVYVFDLASGGLIRSIPKPMAANQFGTAIAVVEDQIFVGGKVGQTGAVFSFDMATGQLVRTFEVPTPTQFSVVDPTLLAVGDNLVVGGFSDDAYVIDVQSGNLLLTINDPGNSDGRFGTALAPYGNDLLVSSHFGPQGHLIDLETGNTLLTFDVPQASDLPALVGAYVSVAELHGNIVVGNPAWKAKPQGPHDEGRAFIVKGIPEPPTLSLFLFAILLPSVRRREVISNAECHLLCQCG